MIRLFLTILFFTGGFLKVSAQSFSELDHQLEEFREKKEYAKAILVAEKAIDAAQVESGKSSDNYYTGFLKLAALFKLNGQLYNSTFIYMKTLEVVVKYRGKRFDEYKKLLTILGPALEDLGVYNKSDSVYTMLQSTILTEPLIDSLEYASVLIYHAEVCLQMGDADKAFSLSYQSLAILKQMNADTGFVYANSLNTLAGIYKMNAGYAKADSLLDLALDALHSSNGNNRDLYNSLLISKGNLFFERGNYIAAEKTLISVLSAMERSGDTLGDQYRRALSESARQYAFTGEYEKVESILFRTKEICMKKDGEQSISYAGILEHLGSFYYLTGQYEKAETFLLQASSLALQVSKQTIPLYRSVQDRLALLYLQLGQYEKAERIFDELNRLAKKSSGPFSIENARILNNRAILYLERGEYKKACELLKLSKTIFVPRLGSDHSEVSKINNNLALCYAKLGDTANAYRLFLESFNISKNNKELNKPEFITALNNLGRYYAETGRPQRAEPMLIEAKDLAVKVYGKNNPVYTRQLSSLSSFYFRTTRYDSSAFYAMQAAISGLGDLNRVFTILSEKEKDQYLEDNTWLLYGNSSMQYTFLNKYPLLTEQTFNLQTFINAITLSDTRKLLRDARLNKDSSVRQLYDQWAHHKALLAKEYSIPKAERGVDLDKLNAQTEQLEKQLLLASPASLEQYNFSPKANDIRNTLANDEALIAFVRFPLLPFPRGDSVIYAAYIIKNNEKAIHFIPLFEERQLSSSALDAETLAMAYRLVVDKKTSAQSPLTRIYQLAWKPLLPYIKNIRRISFVLAGKLNAISFNALPDGSGKLLMDRYDLHQYSSVRDFYHREKGPDVLPAKSIAVFADVDYDIVSAWSSDATDSSYTGPLTNSTYLVAARGSSRGIWNPLPGAAIEGNQVKKLYEDHKIPCSLFSKGAASEEKLKSLNHQSPQVLHFATHGYYLPPLKKQTMSRGSEGASFIHSDDPLFRNGIILAGANNASMGKKLLPGREDGILTAYEISTMDFNSTALVILSACETGLGDVQGLEGVYGLQRAFKLAGVQKLIVSLWSVPDKKTRELMTLFYERWLNGDSIHNAFLNAQKVMARTDPPYFWGAFILIE